jgi:hypothetical protein
VLQAQQLPISNDVKELVSSCITVRKTLNVRSKLLASKDVPEDDDFTAAGKACKALDAAIAASDQMKTENAAKALHDVFSMLGLAPSTPRERLAALESRTANSSGRELFYHLAELAKRAIDADEITKAENYARKLLEVAPAYPKDWNYGNAVFYGNFVLGRLSMRRGNLPQAGGYLLAAGATPGSPQLDSFGPNMTLAKELLDKQQSEVVVQYFELCKRFWKMDEGRLDQWIATVHRGGMPDFAANLDY